MSGELERIRTETLAVGMHVPSGPATAWAPGDWGRDEMADAAAPNGCGGAGWLAALASAAALTMVGTARSAAAQGSPAVR